LIVNLQGSVKDLYRSHSALALGAIATSANKEAVSALQKALTDKDPETRSAASTALAQVHAKAKRAGHR
jgi:HEAT repeat protein